MTAMFNVNFTMRDCASGVSLTMNHYCELPTWVTSCSQLVKSYFARIQLHEFARQFFGTDDVVVELNYVDGVEYAY